MDTQRPTRQQRRASDRNGGRRAPGAQPAILGGAVLAAIVAGWFGWQFWTTRSVVRDGAPSWSPDGGSLVYYSERQGPADLYLTSLTDGRTRQLTETGASEGAPAFSPDGSQIAFDTDRDGNFEIYVMHVDGTGVRRLTRNGARDVAPAWSPDGKQIAFMSDRASRPEFDVYQVNVDGTGLERVTKAPSNWFPQYSPDGTRLAFHVWRDVHVLHLETRRLRRLTTEPHDGMYPSWSPDGKQIAFMTQRNGRMEIFTMDADGENQERLVSMPTGGAIDPRWSPDGRQIAFVHVSEERPDADQAPAQTRVIYLVDVASGRLTRVSR